MLLADWSCPQGNKSMQCKKLSDTSCLVKAIEMLGFNPQGSGRGGFYGHGM